MNENNGEQIQGGVEREILSAGVGLQREMELLQAVVSGEARAGYLIWRSRPSIVVPKRLTHKPGFATACEQLAGEGWPVIVRSTGGDLSPQAPGLLNVAMVFRQERYKDAIRDSYLKLCNPLIEALGTMGVDAYCASVKGAFCDGDYNLVVAGRKLAGTAQRWRKLDSKLELSKNSYAVLAHAVLLIDEDLDQLWKMGNSFYAHCGLDSRIDEGLHVSLAQLLSHQGGALRERCQEAIQVSIDSHLSEEHV